MAFLRGRYESLPTRIDLFPTVFHARDLLFQWEGVDWIEMLIMMGLTCSGNYILWSMEVTRCYDEFGTVLQ